MLKKLLLKSWKEMPVMSLKTKGKAPRVIKGQETWLNCVLGLGGKQSL